MSNLVLEVKLQREIIKAAISSLVHNISFNDSFWEALERPHKNIISRGVNYPITATHVKEAIEALELIETYKR